MQAIIDLFLENPIILGVVIFLLIGIFMNSGGGKKGGGTSAPPTPKE